MPLLLTCSNSEKVSVTATPVTASGRPAQLDGGLRVSVQSGDGTVEQTSPSSFKAVSGDAPGETVFLVEADADLGAGVVLISDIVTLTVTGENAVAFGLVAGAVEPK